MTGRETYPLEEQLCLTERKALLRPQEELEGKVPDSPAVQRFLGVCKSFLRDIEENRRLSDKTKAVARALVLNVAEECRRLYTKGVERNYYEILVAMGFTAALLSTLVVSSLPIPQEAKLSIIAAFNISASVVESVVAKTLARTINDTRIWEKFGVPGIRLIQKSFATAPSRRRRSKAGKE